MSKFRIIICIVIVIVLLISASFIAYKLGGKDKVDEAFSIGNLFQVDKGLIWIEDEDEFSTNDIAKAEEYIKHKITQLYHHDR